MDAEREELRVLTLTWDEDVRNAFLAAYERHRALGRSHEAALMLALAEVLP